MKDYYCYDIYDYFAKIISEADIVVVVVYCLITYATLLKYHVNSLAPMGFLDTSCSGLPNLK